MISWSWVNQNRLRSISFVSSPWGAGVVLACLILLWRRSSSWFPNFKAPVSTHNLDDTLKKTVSSLRSGTKTWFRCSRSTFPLSRKQQQLTCNIRQFWHGRSNKCRTSDLAVFSGTPPLTVVGYFLKEEQQWKCAARSPMSGTLRLGFHSQAARKTHPTWRMISIQI